mgnify:CR=1 FL=1
MGNEGECGLCGTQVKLEEGLKVIVELHESMRIRGTICVCICRSFYAYMHTIFYIYPKSKHA